MCPNIRLFTTLCILHKYFCGRKCLRASICQIKVETLLGTILPPVPNFLSPRHTVVPHQVCFMWFLPFYCWPDPAVCPPSLYGESAAAQTQQSKESLRHIEPIEADTWCNAVAIYPQSHISQKPPPQREQRSPQNQGMKGGLVVLIKVNGWGKHAWGIGTVISYVCCPRGEGHLEVFLSLLHGPRPFV